MLKAICVMIIFMTTFSWASTVDFCGACIERTPKCNRYKVRYDKFRPFLLEGSENDKRWPVQGEQVTYIGHFYNNSPAAGKCVCKWYTNGVFFSQATVAVDGQSFASNSISFNWPEGAETVAGAVTVEMKLSAAPGDKDPVKINNNVKITTRDLTITWFMSQQHFDELSKKTNLWGTCSAVDWTSLQFLDMQDKFEKSIYPFCPNGIIERIRIDQFIVQSNAALGVALDKDPNKDKNDGRWQIWSGKPVDNQETVDNAKNYAKVFGEKIDYGLIHELAHQLGLIDIYTYDVEGPVNIVEWKGAPALIQRIARQKGMMRTHGPLNFSEFSAVALNSQVGRRRGFYGDFQFQVPTTNIIQVFDITGAPLKNAKVECFRRTDRYFDKDKCTFSSKTDKNGKVTLLNSGESYSTEKGWTLHQNPFGFLSVVGANQLFVRITKDSEPFYFWFDCIDANIKYFGGESNLAVYAVNTLLSNKPRKYKAVENIDYKQVGENITLSWKAPSRNVKEYKIYTNNSHPYDQPFQLYATVTDSKAEITRKARQCVYALVTAVYKDGGESSNSELFYMPEYPNYDGNQSNPRFIAGITTLPGKNRIVCLYGSSEEEPSWQRADGSYAGKFSSVHNHLQPRDAVYDKKLDRVLMTETRKNHIVVVDRLGRNVNLKKGWHEAHFIAGSGSELGQLDMPAGLAVDGESRIYVSDYNNNRVQVFTSNGQPICMIPVSKPEGMECDSKGNVYVAETGADQIVVLKFKDNKLNKLKTLKKDYTKGVVDLAFGADDTLYMANNLTSEIIALNRKGKITKYSLPTDGSPGPLKAPHGITVLPGNILVVADSGNNRVVEIDTKKGI